MNLKVKQKVPLTNGEEVTVLKELGQGAQGIVYLVDYKGKMMALKWYKEAVSPAFYTNLQANVENGSPSDIFLWPRYLTKTNSGFCGYVMDLRPEGYYELKDFMLAHVKFASYDAMLSAANAIVHAFKRLHAEGYSYQDLNAGGFFINPKNGDVRICDNDNVSANNSYSGILGVMQYMAPEIVLRKNMPNKYSDRFSLAVILFIILYGNHPFDGLKSTEIPCMTAQYERELYGSEIVFMCDPTDASNRPVKGVHTNVIRRWPIFPAVLKDEFIKTFSKDALRNDPRLRSKEEDWEKTLSKVRSLLVVCPRCNGETFVDQSVSKQTCMRCKKHFSADFALEFSDDRVVLLTDMTYIYGDRDNEPELEVFADKEGMWLKNISKRTLSCITSSGNQREVVKGGEIPVIENITIKFNDLISAKIVKL